MHADDEEDFAELEGESSTVQLRWRVLAFGASILAVGSLSALVIVSAVKDADILSTVALSLAILAFVIQIIVFLAQSGAASRQILRSESLYAETQGLLREVGATAGATQQFLTQQFDTVLQYAFREIPETVDSAGGITEEERDRLVQELETAFQESLANASKVSAKSNIRRPAASPSVKAKIDWLRSWPDETEARDLAPSLVELSPLGARSLAKYAQDLASALSAGRLPGLRWKEGLTTPTRAELLDAGLIEEDVRGNRSYGRLTSRGERVARLILGEQPPPEYLNELLGPI